MLPRHSPPLGDSFMSPALRRVPRLVLLCSVLLGFARAAAAQEAESSLPEKVRFVTADGVTIFGTFYKGPKAAPTVLMLHGLGATENRSKKNWIELAKTLQKDFSVLTFDFRGHGESTEVDGKLYASFKPNQYATKGGFRADRTRLDFKDIEKHAYPLFCNDIAAAKSYLERTKNDLGLCNVQNFLVV